MTLDKDDLAAAANFFHVGREFKYLDQKIKVSETRSVLNTSRSYIAKEISVTCNYVDKVGEIHKIVFNDEEVIELHKELLVPVYKK